MAGPRPTTNLDVTITASGNGMFQAIGTINGVRVGQSAFPPPLAPLELDHLIGQIGGRVPTVGTLADLARGFGLRLFGSVFGGSLRSGYDEAVRLADEHDGPLRIRLDLTEAPALGPIPWEFLYSPSHRRPLGTSTETSVTRGLSAEPSPQPIHVAGPLDVVVIVANPGHIAFSPFDIEAEHRRLEDALEPLVEHGVLRLHRHRAHLDGLGRRLGELGANVVHIIGHSDAGDAGDEAALLFETADGGTDRVTGARLAAELGGLEDLGVVVISGGDGARSSVEDPVGQVAGHLIDGPVGAVVGMQFEMSHTAAATFAEKFHLGLATGARVDAAVGAARWWLYHDAPNDAAWATPAVHLHADDGRVFDVAAGGSIPPGLAAEFTWIPMLVAAEEAVAHGHSDRAVELATAAVALGAPERLATSAVSPRPVPGGADPVLSPPADWLSGSSSMSEPSIDPAPPTPDPVPAAAPPPVTDPTPPVADPYPSEAQTVIQSAVDARPPTPVAPATAPVYEPLEPEPATGTVARGIAAAAILAILVFGGVFLLLRGDDAEPAAATTTQPTETAATVTGARLVASTDELTVEAAVTSFASSTIELANNGTATAIVSLNEPVTPWSVANGCGASLDAGASCEIVVTFTPTREGASNDFLGIGDGVGELQIQLRGNGLPAPPSELQTTPRFVEVTGRVGESTEAALEILNSGSVDTTLVIEPVAAPWTSTSDCPTELGAGASCMVTLLFEPEETGRTDRVLVIQDESTTVEIPLTGIATASQLRLAPDSVFAEIELGEPFEATVTLFNDGDAGADLTFTDPAAPWVADTTACGASLEPASSCAISVSFEPTTAGVDQISTLEVSDGLETTLTATFTGVAVELFPNLVITAFEPSSSDVVGNAVVTAAVVRFANIGTTASAPTRLYLSSTDAANSPILIPLGGDDGPTGVAVGSLEPGGEASVEVVYRLEVDDAGGRGVLPVTFEIDRCLVASDPGECVENEESSEDDNRYESTFLLETGTYDPVGPQ